MPRRVFQGPLAAAPDPSLPPPPPSPLILKLRQDWRWAAISQFLWTFSDAFGLLDWDIEELENDLDGDETKLLPELIAKLLYALTYNRQINRDNAFDNLRKQYLKRLPDSTPLGSLEEQIEWATLGLSQKVEILWELCEWQLDDPAKFRALLKNEEEAPSWRIDPLGWDRSGNTYFLFDDNRLWVQRLLPPPPRPPKKSSLKAKRAQRALKRSKPSTSRSKKPPPKPSSARPAPTPPPAKLKEEEVVSGSRRRTQVQLYGNPTPTVLALKRGGVKETPPTTRGTRSSGRLNPSASSAGPSRLGEQGSPADTPSKPSAKTTPLPLGTRVSRRLRNVDDEWQQLPSEWMGNDEEKEEATKDSRGEKGKMTNGARKANGRRTKSDDDSELSSLTDEEEHQAQLHLSQDKASSPLEAKDERDEDDDEPLTPLPDTATASINQEEVDEDMDGDTAAEVKDEEEEDEAEEPLFESNDANGEEEEMEETDEVKLAVKMANTLPEDFVEWEAVCVTLYDWKTFPERFAKSKDADEKALYRMVVDTVGPQVIEALTAKEQERLKQEAINNRKRSSRILARDLEKEEQARRETAQREMEERMEKQRREEDRARKEEEDLLARERAREERLREREERAAAREGVVTAKLVAEQEAKERADRDRESRKRRRELGLDSDVDDLSRAGSRDITPRMDVADTSKVANGNSDRWELNCEVCRKQGWNIDEDQDIVCCDDCGRWQHVDCHNRLDLSEGRPIRNWDKVDFKCKDCRRRAARKRQRLEEMSASSPNGVSPIQGYPHSISQASPSSSTSARLPAAPPLQTGQYYLPYPADGKSVPPAGYAVYYPNQNGAQGSGHPVQMARPQQPMPHGVQPGYPPRPMSNHGQPPGPSPYSANGPYGPMTHHTGPGPSGPPPASQSGYAAHPAPPHLGHQSHQGHAPHLGHQGHQGHAPHPGHRGHAPHSGYPMHTGQGMVPRTSPPSHPQYPTHPPHGLPSPLSRPMPSVDGSSSVRPLSASVSPVNSSQGLVSPAYRPGPHMVQSSVPHGAAHPFAPRPMPSMGRQGPSPPSMGRSGPSPPSNGSAYGPGPHPNPGSYSQGQGPPGLHAYSSHPGMPSGGHQPYPSPQSRPANPPAYPSPSPLQRPSSAIAPNQPSPRLPHVPAAMPVRPTQIQIAQPAQPARPPQTAQNAPPARPPQSAQPAQPAYPPVAQVARPAPPKSAPSPTRPSSLAASSSEGVEAGQRPTLNGPSQSGGTPQAIVSPKAPTMPPVQAPSAVNGAPTANGEPNPQPSAPVNRSAQTDGA